MYTLEVGHGKQQGKGSGLLERSRKDKTNLSGSSADICLIKVIT